MILDTIIGPMDASVLEKVVTTTEIPTGTQTTIEYRYRGELVKCDQHISISEAALLAQGFADSPL